MRRSVSKTVVAGVASVLAATSALAYDSSSYVQTGLVAQWDGIDNAGAGAGHDSSATVWKDLKGGYEFALNGVTVNSDSLSFTGATSSYGVLSGTPAYEAFPLGMKTVEIRYIFDGSSSDQVVLHGPVNTGVAYGIHADAGYSYSMIHNAVNSWSFYNPGFYVEETVAFPYKASNAIQGLFYAGGVTKREITNKTAYFGAVGSADASAWIGKTAANAKPFKGKIFAIRVYNRLLSAEEVALNSAIDRRRFEGVADFVIADIPEQTYDGTNPCQPTPSVTDREAGTVLTPGEDFDFSYQTNTAPGEGLVIVTGKADAGYGWASASAPFAIRYSQANVRTCTWTNTDVSAAQAWTNTASWSDLDDDGIGDVPNPGDNVNIPAAAYINFAGADIGNLRHTGGALKIHCAGGTMTNSGDFVSTGASVDFYSGTIFFSAGEHVFSNSCTVTHDSATYFKGPGGFTKKGGGLFYYGSSAIDCYLFTGPLKIREGQFKTQGYGPASFNGPREILVDGATASLSLQKAGQMSGLITLRLRNKGSVVVVGAQYAHRIFIDDTGCAVGTWGFWNSTDVDYKSLRVNTGGTAGYYANAMSGPVADPYEGIGNALWSGETRHWTGATSTAWDTDSNWEEGLAPQLLDDVVIPADAPNAPALLTSITWTYLHSITTAKDIGTNGRRLYLTGDLNLDGGSFSAYPTIELSKGDHVIGGTGDLYLKWHSSLTYSLGGEGGVIKRGSGKIYTGTASPVMIKGGLAVEGGTFQLSNAGDTFPYCTNITVSGAGSLFSVASAVINTNATVSLNDSGQLKLNGSFTNLVYRYVMENNCQKANRTYGSTASEAVKTDDVHFVGAGMIQPWYDDIPLGFMLILR